MQEIVGEEAQGFRQSEESASQWADKHEKSDNAFAYQKFYTDNWFYGDQPGNPPPCFKEDYSCQVAYENRQRAITGITIFLSLVLLILIITVVLFIRTRKREIKEDENADL